MHSILSGCAAALLATAGLVATAGEAAADTMLGECLVVADPTPSHHTECAGLDLGDPNSVVFDFSYADLSDTTVRGALSGSTFVNADLTGARWRSWGHVIGSDLTGATLDGADFGNLIADDAIFDNASLVGALLGSTSIYRGSSFVGADLTDADFTEAIFGFFGEPSPMADMTGAILTGADFSRTNVVPFPPQPVTATGASGAAVTWNPPSYTLIGQHLGDCSAPGLGIVTSGSMFPVGTTTVTCQVVSTSNGTFGTGSFDVTVDPQEGGEEDSASITSGSSTTFTVGTSGTFTVTTTGSPTPALALSGSLPQGVSFVDNGDGTATLAGSPIEGSGGVYEPQVTATAGTASDVQLFTLTVTEAPSITSPAAVSFTPGTHGTFHIAATGFPAPLITTSAPVLPAGITVVDGTVSGAPAPGSGGTYPVTVGASNGAGFDQQTLTITVTEDVSITSPASATFTVGTAGSFLVQASGTSTPQLSFSGVLPDGVTFTAHQDGTATLAGVAGPGSGGAYSLELTASSGSASAVQSFTLNVDEAPAIGGPAEADLTVGQEGVLTLAATGTPAPTLTLAGALPTGVSFNDGVIEGTPAAGSGGVYEVSVTASNGVGADAVHELTLTVAEAPSFTSPSTATFTVGTEGSFAVTTAGYPTDASISTSDVLPEGLVLTDNGDGTAVLVGTPSTPGTFTVGLSASNGVSPDASQLLTLTVTEAPVITSPDRASFTVGQEGTFEVVASGNPVPTITQAGVLPDGLSFASGAFSGNPTTGSGGTYAVTVTASNGVGPEAVQQLTLTVEEAPLITSDDAATFVAGESGNLTVTTTGYPAPAISTTDGLPEGVELTDHGDGTATITGTPQALTGGSYELTLTAANGVLPDAVQLLTLTVEEAPAFTTEAVAEMTIATAATIVMETVGFPVAVLTVEGALPSGVTFVDNGDGTATLSGTPAPGTSGVYPMVLTADNGIGQAAVQALTLSIALVETTTTLTASPTPAVSGEPLTLTVLVDPPPGPPTGTVEVFDGATLLGSAELTPISTTTSRATITVIAPSDLGTHSLVAVYGGDESYAGSSSEPLEITVVAAPAPDPTGDEGPTAGSDDPTAGSDDPTGGGTATDDGGSGDLAATGVSVGAVALGGTLAILLGALMLLLMARRRTARS